MIYKFPRPSNLFKELLPGYKGSYIEMCVPQTDDEEYCYVELTENQFPGFTEHFGDNGSKVDNAEEYPAGVNNKIRNRIEKFTVVRPGYREKSY
jgi:hypothetical protein